MEKMAKLNVPCIIFPLHISKLESQSTDSMTETPLMDTDSR